MLSSEVSWSTCLSKDGANFNEKIGKLGAYEVEIDNMPDPETVVLMWFITHTPNSTMGSGYLMDVHEVMLKQLTI